MEAAAQAPSENQSEILRISDFASTDTIINLNSFLFITDKNQTTYPWEDFSRIKNWKPWEMRFGDEKDTGILVKMQIENEEEDTVPGILYLHDLQKVTIYLNGLPS